MVPFTMLHLLMFFSKYKWLYLISHKSQATSVFLQFKALAENQTGFSLKTLQTYNVKEFVLLTKLLNTYGITHSLTCPHTHQQNGSVERKHRHIVDTDLALIVAACLPLRFWGEVFSSVVFTINILSTPVLHNLSLYEMLFSQKPNYTSKSFGCACYPLLRPYNQHKFDFCSSLCFLGYASNRKGYICLTPSGKFIFSRNVLFNELPFPYSIPSSLFTGSANINTDSLAFSPILTVIFAPPTTSPSSISPESPSLLSSAPSPSISTTSLMPTAASSLNAHSMITRAKDGIFKPKALQSSLSADLPEPSTYKQALTQPHWLHAMKAEYDALMQNNTWTLTTLPPTTNVVGCKWVFKKKYNVDGSLQRYKAHLVPKGFHQ